MFTGNEDHSISLQDAAALTGKFRQILMPLLGGKKGEYFSQAAINSLLSQEGVVGIRIYLGLSDDLIPLPKLVLVGVKANGDDVVAGEIVENGTFCPPSCGSINILNS